MSVDVERPFYELFVSLFMEFGKWTIRNEEMLYVPQPPKCPFFPSDVLCRLGGVGNG
jgi:hypothetical protein